MPKRRATGTAKRDPAAELARAAARRADEHHVFRLYVTGMSPRSTLAITVTKEVCEERLAGRYDLEVVDLYERPDAVEGDPVLAVPTLERRSPLPRLRLIGNFSRDRLNAALGLSHTG